MTILQILAISLVVLLACSFILIVWFFYERNRHRKECDITYKDLTNEQLDELVKKFADNQNKWGR